MLAPPLQQRTYCPKPWHAESTRSKTPGVCAWPMDIVRLSTSRPKRVRASFHACLASAGMVIGQRDGIIHVRPRCVFSLSTSVPLAHIISAVSA